MERNKKIFFILLFVLVAMRLINITMPLLEGTTMRQVQTAVIAKNILKDNFNILYPKTDFSGNSTAYLALEFPLLNLLAALGYWLLGAVHEWFGRILSILFFSGAAIFLYNIVKKLFGEEVSLWSVAVFGLSPLSIIFSRCFMPDFEMIFFSLGAFYFMLQYIDSLKSRNFWLSAVFIALAMLVKPHSFYMYIVIFFLLFQNKEKLPVFRPSNWLYFTLTLIPAALWYYHGKNLHSLFEKEQAFNFQVSNWFNLSELLSVKFYTQVFEIFSGILLTPFGLSLLIFGLFLKTKGKENLLLAWLAASIIYLIAFITHITDPYYNLNFLPVASVIIARAIVHLKQSSLTNTYLKNNWAKIILIIIVLPFWARYSIYAYIIPKGYKHIPQATQKSQTITSPGDLFIAANPGGSAALYYLDRKGWTFDLPGTSTEKTQAAINYLSKLINSRATYFICAVTTELEQSPEFNKYLLNSYKIVAEESGKYILFKLTK